MSVTPQFASRAQASCILAGVTLMAWRALAAEVPLTAEGALVYA